MTTKNSLMQILVGDAAQEFCNLYNALIEYGRKTNKPIDINSLIKSKSVKSALLKQNIDANAQLQFTTALERANKEYHKLLKAPEGQKKQDKIY
jgi:hypothetical protein